MRTGLPETSKGPLGRPKVYGVHRSTLLSRARGCPDGRPGAVDRTFPEGEEVKRRPWGSVSGACALIVTYRGFQHSGCPQKPSDGKTPEQAFIRAVPAAGVARPRRRTKCKTPGTYAKKPDHRCRTGAPAPE